MTFANLTISRDAVASMAQYGDLGTLQALYREVRRTMIRLGLGEFDSPPATSLPALTAVEPVGTTPSVLDVIGWLNSLNTDSDAVDPDSDSDDDSIDDLEFLERLFVSADNRINPAFKAALVALE